jgi:predicted transcriptional regulator
MMLLSIEIPPQTEARLRQQAEASGQDMRSYVSQLIEQSATKPSLDELLAPLRRQFAGTNVSDEELVSDITAAQTEYRAEQQKKTA